MKFSRKQKIGDQPSVLTTKLKKQRFWFILNTILTLVYLIWRFFFTIPIGYGLVSFIAGIALFAVEFLGMWEAMIHYFNMHDLEDKPLPEIPLERYPEVDVFIATYNEPVELLYKTVNGCKHMHYPDKSKVHIYLCDDGRRSEVKQLAEKMGILYFDRPNNEHAKAGNLNHAMKKTSSPFIVTLDADMIPKHEFLLKTIPYFVEQDLKNQELPEEKREYIGFVQSPQAFYNPDLFQFNLFLEGRIPNEQDFFYRDVQVSRNKSNSVIYGGSNTVLSRRALEDVGGFYTGSVTEDYATGILMQKKQYKCIAIKEVLASGLSPQDMKNLVTQRVRWARGVIDTNRKMHILSTPDLTLGQKVNYWASKWYWYFPIKRLIYVLSPILYSVFGYMVIRCTLSEVLLFWLPMYISSNISLRLLSGNIRTTKWTGIYETILSPYMMVPVILETIGIRLKSFKVTEKNASAKKDDQKILYSIPFVLLSVLSVIGIVSCIVRMFASGSTGLIVVLFWLCFNLFLLLMSLFFILGRNYLRKSERAQISEECVLSFRGRKITAITKDISETGIAVVLTKPINIDENDEVQIDITTEQYQARVYGSIILTDKLTADTWKYAFHIHDFGDSLDGFLQIIYDRVPTLPQKIEASSGVYNDLRVNLSKRAMRQFYQRRKRTRIPIDAVVYDYDHRPYKVVDINFKYLTIEGHSEKERLNLILDSELELVLECETIRTIRSGQSLLEIKNYEEITNDMQQISALEQWVFSKYQTRSELDKGSLLGSPREEGETEKTYFKEFDHV